MSNQGKPKSSLQLFIIIIVICIIIKALMGMFNMINSITDNILNSVAIENTIVEEPFVDIEENDENIIRGYVNTFAGYTSLFAANGGNITTEDSNIGKRLIDKKVDIEIEDDDEKIVDAFINGKIQFFAMTINKLPIIVNKLEDASIEPIVPYLIDTSTGGDGIVAYEGITNVKDLQNARIAMVKDSVSTTIPVWLMNQSELTEEEINRIISRFVYFDSTQEAVKAFNNGITNAISTWDISGSLKRKDSHLLFSTSSAEYLVIDGFVINRTFYLNHKEDFTQIIDGILDTVNDMEKGENLGEYYGYIRSAVPDYAEFKNSELSEELLYAKFLGYNKNIEAFGIARDIYKDFAKIWKQLGYSTSTKYVDRLFDMTPLKSLENEWKENEYYYQDQFVAGKVEDYAQDDSLIKQYAKILFNDDTSTFKNGYEASNKELMDEFVKVAKVLNKTVIKITGHVNLGQGSSYFDDATQSYLLTPGYASNDFAYQLSRMRAEAVKEYLVSQGIDEARIIVEGVGGDKPIDLNDTEEGRANNRSCEIAFYQSGY